MLSSRRLSYQNEGDSSETLFLDSKNGLCPQLLGNEEIYIRDSIHKLEAWGARAIDINMGCPVKKALRHNYGVALMGDSLYAAEITNMAVRHAKVPVSVKLRAGFQRDEKFLVEFAKGIEGAGATWITLHPRTADQKRRGSADWAQIKLLKNHLKIPVVGNGDIQTLEDIERMIQETSCDRVMVGRALLAKPWLIAAGFKKFSSEKWACDDDIYLPMSTEEESAFYGRFLMRVLELSRAHYDEIDGMKKLRFLAYHSCVWLEFGHTLYAKIKNAPTYVAAFEEIEEFFSSSHRSFERTARCH
jgi:tRNA-dihydrouridine synthase